MDGGSMFVIHANWTVGKLHLWAESLERFSHTNNCAFSKSDSDPELLKQPELTTGLPLTKTNTL